MNTKPIQRRGSPGGVARDYRVISTRGGIRLVQHGTVLSEVRSHPGPTHSVADVIAAVLQALRAGPRVAMLGFAAGGTLAPLRAMGGAQVVDAVDLDDSGWRLFRRWGGRWAGEVRFQRAEACDWLRCNPRRYEAVIEDLSIARDSDVFKPSVTWSDLPPLIHRRLCREGVALFNLLRPEPVTWEEAVASARLAAEPRRLAGAGVRRPASSQAGREPSSHRRLRGASWREGIQRVVCKGLASRVVHFTDYENRLVVVGRQLPSARELSRQVRLQLKSIGSRLASRIAVRPG
ncbi:MAG: hypothetical protein MUE94_05635 [Verrucomicrobia bacterium]|nr:hypothetical protein [Verrucomicrobiota bacterium]